MFEHSNGSAQPTLERVLIIGYGKFGRTKAFVWRSLGLDVLVYDVRREPVQAARTDGFSLYEPPAGVPDTYLLDISTPAGHHFGALRWAFAHGAGSPRAILIEKPIVSSSSELAELRLFVNTTGKRHLATRIFVNDSYYSSPALALVRDRIKAQGEPIESIDIELSKNRLLETQRGRFFDAELGVFGIEWPHIVAILETLGIDPAVLLSNTPTLVHKASDLSNQGLSLETTAGGLFIKVSSWLGDFRVHGAASTLSENVGVTRRVRVATSTRCYSLEFDPVPGLPRFHAMLRTSALPSGHKGEIVSDDHLRGHLSLFARQQALPSGTGLFGFENAVRVALILTELRRKCILETVGQGNSIHAGKCQNAKAT